MYFCIERLEYRDVFSTMAYFPMCGSDNTIIWSDLKTVNGYFKRLKTWLTVGYYDLTINSTKYLLCVHNGNGYCDTIPYFDFTYKGKVIKRKVNFQLLVKE